jgi:hypothetical protein
MPLFAGLSSLQALSFAYNFLLISANGEIVTPALITPTSGHCRSVHWSTTNVIESSDRKELAPVREQTRSRRVYDARNYGAEIDGSQAEDVGAIKGGATGSSPRSAIRPLGGGTATPAMRAWHWSAL